MHHWASFSANLLCRPSNRRPGLWTCQNQIMHNYMELWPTKQNGLATRPKWFCGFPAPSYSRTNKEGKYQYELTQWWLNEITSDTMAGLMIVCWRDFHSFVGRPIIPHNCVCYTNLTLKILPWPPGLNLNWFQGNHYAKQSLVELPWKWYAIILKTLKKTEK